SQHPDSNCGPTDYKSAVGVERNGNASKCSRWRNSPLEPMLQAIRNVRERKKHDPARIDPLRNEPGHPRRESFGLARAGPGNGKNWALARGGSAKLFRVQIVSQIRTCPLEDTYRH